MPQEAKQPPATDSKTAGVTAAASLIRCLRLCLPVVLFVSASLASTSLRDIDGHIHTVPLNPGFKATVLYFVTHDCPISNRYAPEIRRICHDYEPKGVRCLVAYVDPTVGTDEIREHLRQYGGSQPAIHDVDHELVRLADATVTPESALFNETGELVYLGRIDNLYAALGTPRRRATVSDLRDALDEVLSAKPVSRPRAKAVGCYIPSLDVIRRGGLK